MIEIKDRQSARARGQEANAVGVPPSTTTRAVSGEERAAYGVRWDGLATTILT